MTKARKVKINDVVDNALGTDIGYWHSIEQYVGPLVFFNCSIHELFHSCRQVAARGWASAV